ncbi:death-associated protein 1-like [Palaemon carinicauda]|uniref:death-associated protein 1-like n=1 Tax=Palaemon carinicauda TaxID=392227 RepID=UPI0035B5830D
MSSNEEVEIKGGHPPALKVGGVRIAQKTKLEDGVPAKPRKNSENGEDEFKSPLKAPVMIQTQVMGKPERDFPVAAVKHTHEKPVPTHETRSGHVTKPAVIQQPRK